MSFLTKTRKPLGLAIAALSAAGMATQLNAAILEEVVVTAQKREQNLQDVGVSVSAFTGKQTRALGWNNSEDIAAQTPGLVTASFAGDSTVSIFSVRGVGQNDFADHQEAPTAMYIDGVYIASTGAAGFQMFDVERVEVLRGPQGTLFGRNATGGLMHIINKKPTEEFEGYVDVTLGDFDQRRFEAAVSGPLAENVLGRLSVLQESADGYFENKGAGDDLRSRDYMSWRGQLEFRAGDNATVNWSAWQNVTDHATGGIYDRITPSGVDYTGRGNDYPKANEGAPDVEGEVDKDSHGIMQTVVIDTKAFTVTSITDFQKIDKYYLEDSDGGPDAYLWYDAAADVEQFSQELRLNGESEGLKWQAGLYYLNIDGVYSSQINIPSFGGNPKNDYTLSTESYSIFGQIEYDLTDSLLLTAGLRWTDDEKEFDITSQCLETTLQAAKDVFGPNSVGPGTGVDCAYLESFGADVVLTLPGEQNFERHDEDYSGKLQLDYRMVDDVLLYAGVSRGMKGGGFTAPLDGLLAEPAMSYEPEILTSYEIGIKSEWWDGKVRLNASAFQYDYEDYQGFVFVGLTSVVVNNDATVTGGEIELYVSPSEGWDISLGVAILDAEVEDVTFRDGVTVEDQDKTTSPDLTANLLIRKGWDLSDGAEFAVQVDGQYIDEQQLGTENSDLAMTSSYSIWNARVSYTTENWDVAAFVKNAGDKEYRTYAFDLETDFGYSLEVYGPPRWAGIQAQYRF
ncbi:TonB-dependent receptor [Dasania sp. GY-MA-18]|uniref:TonB-dependent receptor n=1 Tax=Dasania phycosphaerae TaxID=2950436 RepID=A0A9J6RLF9_9GAMM|nr:MULTISPECIES: TonB-dependent receptor [Dasania]MCR8922829.1 TonB-dependent receptor [Dasania sp. GY-MA-18]MCZ0865260.1 TonB-dependent receptor [Dasania phycosphaerae]MCZ0868985.1 TonB-dependent receptor [Dasania phycosphaerae]